MDHSLGEKTEKHSEIFKRRGVIQSNVNLKHDWQNLLLISFFHVILWLETKRLVWTIGIAVISNLRLSLRFWKKSFSFHDLNGCRYIFSFWLLILAGFIMRQQFRTHQLTRMEILLLQSSWMKQRGKNTKQNLGRLINGLFPVCKSFNWKKARKNSTMALAWGLCRGRRVRDGKF